MWVSPVACARATMLAGSPPSAYCGCQIHIPLPVGTTGVGGGGGAVVVVGATVVVVGGTVVEVVVGAPVVEVVVGAMVVVVVTWGNAMWFRNIDALLVAPCACATPAMNRPSAAMTMGATTRRWDL